MKTNKYTYIVPIDTEIHVLFNGINKRFLCIDNEKVDSYVELLKNPNKYIDSHKTIIERLVALGLILNDNEDEQDILRAMRKSYIDFKEYKTTIVPTFDCNYKCWYCTQKHEPVKIDQEKITRIIKHIKKYLIENQIESYVLSWFGGEPLMQPQIIDSVTSELKSFCQENKIKFDASITTNGALLNDENIKMLTRNDINFYQIAIDGDEKNHNLNKHDKLSDNSFGLVLSNIVNLLQYNKKADVKLRLNYTLATLKSKHLLDDICKYIPEEYRRLIRVDLQKVWQVKEDLVPIDLLNNLQQGLVKCGFELVTEHVFSMCYVEKKHYNMFYYNGGVEKCDKQALDKIRGYLNEEGDIVWKERHIFADYDLLSDDCVCGNCFYYPLCYNGCPIEREQRIKANKGQVICGYAGDYSIFENRIQDYCWRVINNLTLQKE